MRAAVLLLGGCAGIVPFGVCSAARPVAAAATTAPARPNALTQPLADGCQRNPGALLTGQSPEWTYVYNTPASEPAPPPQWVTGTVSSGNPAFAAVHTSGGDLPSGHTAYDFNVNILPDPQYAFLVGGDPAARTGNFAGNDEGTGRLHTEWQDLTVPRFAWAEPGDRLTELGSWVWDCGHWGTPTDFFSPDYLLPKVGQPCVGQPDPAQCTITGEGTEFHPYRALWDLRAGSPNGPYGESEGELFVSTEKTRAGIEADCAHRNPPQLGALAYGPGYTACIQSEPDWQDVSGDYSFFLPAPPRPSPGAHLTMRVVDRGSSGAPPPTLTPEGGGVRVRLRLNPAPGQRAVVAATVFAGWDVPPPGGLPTHVHVTFDRLEVHRAMDPGCSATAPVPGCADESTRTNQLTTPPGEWNLYYDVSGIWGQWNNAEFDPLDGSTFPGTQSADLYVAPGAGWRLFVHGRECDLGGLGVEADCPNDRTEIADDNDVVGQILDVYPSVQASVGTHLSNGQTHRSDPTSTCPDTNPQGCYSLTYTVSVIDDGAQRSGVFAVTGATGGGSPVTAAGAGATAAIPAAVMAAAAPLARRRRRRLSPGPAPSSGPPRAP